MAQKVKFKRKTTAEIEDLAVEDGSLIYNVDNGKTYMDYGNDRIQTGGNADTMIAIGGTQPTDNDIKIWIEEKNNQDYDTFNYRNSTTSDWELLNLPPTGDTLPVGAIVEYSGSEVPYGWEQYSTGKIRKTAQAIGAVGTMATTYSSSSNAYYNAPYINTMCTISNTEKRIGSFRKYNGVTVPLYSKTFYLTLNQFTGTAPDSISSNLLSNISATYVMVDKNNTFLHRTSGASIYGTRVNNAAYSFEVHTVTLSGQCQCYLGTALNNSSTDYIVITLNYTKS